MEKVKLDIFENGQEQFTQCLRVLLATGQISIVIGLPSGAGTCYEFYSRSVSWRMIDTMVGKPSGGGARQPGSGPG